MDKRYQIFISSTFSDLEEERRMIMETIIDLNCFPAGMEMFPSTDTKQLDYIKNVIDNSDYYILILAGRYGTLAKDGVSYTEKEYNYAKKKGIPVLAFIRKNINLLPHRLVDSDSKKIEKLECFKNKVKKGRLVSFWESPLELKFQIHSSLVKEFKLHPRKGWIRESNLLITEQADQELRTECSKYSLDFKIDRNFMNNVEVKKLLADERYLPFGYVINSGTIHSIDLSRTYCYMISGKRRTGKTNVLKVLIRSALAKGDMVYIIELGGVELKETFQNTKAVIASTVDEVFNICKEMVPIYKERNEYVREYKNKGYGSEEIFIEMKKYSRIHVFIEDLSVFLDCISPINDTRNIYSYLENIIAKGHSHNTYYYYTLNQSASRLNKVGNNLYDLFIDDKLGIHLGGELNDERILNFKSLDYKMRAMSTKVGVGFTKTYHNISGSVFRYDEEFFVLVPCYN